MPDSCKGTGSVYSGPFLPAETLVAFSLLTAGNLEEEVLQETVGAAFGLWSESLSLAAKHTIANTGVHVSSPSLLRGCRELGANDPRGADWQRNPCLLLTHMLSCPGNCDCGGGQWCETARIVLGHLFICENPSCCLCSAWLEKDHFAVFSSSRTTMLLLETCVGTYVGSFPETAVHTGQWNLERRRTDADGVLKHPYDDTEGPTLCVKNMTTFISKTDQR